MAGKKLSAVHPGEVLREEFLVPMDLSQYRLARSMGVPARRINEIVHEKRAISADTALRLGRFFGTSPEFWINLQTNYDLEEQRSKLGSRLDEVVVYRFAATSQTTRNVRASASVAPVTYRAARTTTNTVQQAAARRAPKHR